MKKIDYKKELKDFYRPSAKKAAIVEVPALSYLMIDGQGLGEQRKAYQDAIQTLYPVAYTLKFYCKKELNFDFTVMPLEGLWWADDMNDFVNNNRERWRWTLMIMQPDVITQDLVEWAKKEVKTKKNPTALDLLRFEQLDEGKAAQILYLGPYSEEHTTIMGLHNLIKETGGKLDGKHHEIYLNDPRKVAPEKLKTIIRQPFA